jgi:hypothetical protein
MLVRIPRMADHRRHVVVEPCIRDLKAAVGLRHCPSGKSSANAAWLVIATPAHNLLRWVAAIGLGGRGQPGTRTTSAGSPVVTVASRGAMASCAPSIPVGHVGTT